LVGWLVGRLICWGFLNEVWPANQQKAQLRTWGKFIVFAGILTHPSYPAIFPQSTWVDKRQNSVLLI
jgi:hypothetical protein